MAVIGRPIGVPGHTSQLLDAPTDLDSGTANSFTMKVGGVAVSPDESSLAVYISNVRQIPGDAYTVSGSTLTFEGTVTTSNYSYAIIMGDAMYVENNSVDESKLKVSNGPTNGQFLSAQSGNPGGLTWAAVSDAPISSVTNFGDNNRIVTASGAAAANAEANLTFTGSALQCTGTINVGADTDGYDVKFFGDTTGKYMLWDESADKLIVSGAIQTGDLILNNERGHWTIVEEADYLSIKNENTGKKYKFVLEEINE